MRQKINRIYGLIILFGLVFGGCATFQKVPSYPYYSQDQEVMLGIFRFKIEETYWADQTEMYATENMPVEYLTQIPKVKPDVKFLVTVLSITNTGRTPVAMNPVWLALRNEQGFEYSPSQKAGTPQVVGGILQTFNPNMPFKTKIVFDVPGGVYSLIVLHGIDTGTGWTKKGNELFKWRLSPIEK